MDSGENQDVIRFYLSENWKMFLNGRLWQSGFGYRKGTCVKTLYKRAWQVGFVRQPKAFGVGLPRQMRQGTTVEIEKTYKKYFSISRFREL